MIKVTLGGATPKNEKPKYPYFGEWVSGVVKVVIFFTNKDTGICLYSNWQACQIGELYTNSGWCEEDFKPIDYPITFENEF